MKFMTRPLELDAYQVPATEPGEMASMLKGMPAWMRDAVSTGSCTVKEKPSSDYLHIDVLAARGSTTASPGDWIVQWDDGPVRVMPDASFMSMCRYHGYYPAPEHLLIEQSLCMINAERRRQIEVEGFDAHHDDVVNDAEDLAWLACYYAMPCAIQRPDLLARPSDMYQEAAWPSKWAKRESKSRIQQLVVAGASIAAEIARRLRADAKVRSATSANGA